MGKVCENGEKFQWPENIEGNDHPVRILQKINCSIMDAIGSVALVFEDNISTDKMGKKSSKELNCSLEVPCSEIVQEISMRYNADLNQI